MQVDAYFQGFCWLCLFIVLVLSYELTSIHPAVNNSLGISLGARAHDRYNVYKDQKEDFWKVNEICARERLKYFRKACSRLPFSLRKSTHIHDFNTLNGIIHDNHSIMVVAFPNSGSSDFKIDLYNSIHETMLPKDPLTSEKLRPERYGFHTFQAEPSSKAIKSKYNRYRVILSVLHPWKRLEAEYEGMLLSNSSQSGHTNNSVTGKVDANDNQLTFDAFLDLVIEGKHQKDILRPYIDYCTAIKNVNFLTRSETSSLDVLLLARKFLFKEIDTTQHQSTRFDSLPNFTIALPHFNTLEDPARYIAMLEPYYRHDLEMLKYTYNIDPTGQVTGSCEVTSHGVCC